MPIGKILDDTDNLSPMAPKPQFQANGIFDPYLPEGCLVDDEIFFIDRAGPGKVAAFDDSQADCREKVVVDRHKSRENLLFGRSSFPIDIADPALDIGRQDAAAGDTHDIGMVQEFLSDNLHRIPGFFLHQVIDNVLLGHPEVAVHDKRYLRLDDEGSYDEHGR